MRMVQVMLNCGHQKRLREKRLDSLDTLCHRCQNIQYIVAISPLAPTVGKSPDRVIGSTHHQHQLALDLDLKD